MKKIIGLLFCIVCLNAHAQDTVNVDLGKGIGKQNEKRERTGEWKIYDQNWQLLYLVNYENGLLAGEWKSYFLNRQLACVGKYELGVRTGEWTCYHKTGQLLEFGKYENGVLTGEWKSYYTNGQLQSIGNFGNLDNGGPKTVSRINYEPGLRDYTNMKRGEWKYYDESGKLLRTETHN